MNYFVIAVLLAAVAQVAHSSSQYKRAESANYLNNANSDEDDVDSGKFFNQNGQTNSNSDEIFQGQFQGQEQRQGQGQRQGQEQEEGQRQGSGQGHRHPTLGIYWGHPKGKRYYRINYQGMSDGKQDAQKGQQNQGQNVNVHGHEWLRQEQQLWERQRQQQQQYQQQQHEHQPWFKQQPSDEQQQYQHKPYSQQPYQHQQQQQQEQQHHQNQHGSNYDSSDNAYARGVYEDGSQYLKQHKMDDQSYFDFDHDKSLQQQQQMYQIGGKQRVFHTNEQQSGQGGRFVVNEQRHRGSQQDSDEGDSVEIKNSVRGSNKPSL